MNSVCDILVVVLVATKTQDLFLKFTVTDATHSGGIAVFQVTLTPGVEPPTLSVLTVTVDDEN